jgi:acetyl-CoA acetyltransferase
MRKVAVLGVGMTPFGKFPERSLKSLGIEASLAALRDSGVRPQGIEVAYVGNAVAGLMTGQSMILGEVILRELGIVGIPITNVENACGSGSSALREAWIAVGSGLYDVALALGVEKLHVGDLARTTYALSGATDMETEGGLGLTFPGHWALKTKVHMEKYGTTAEQLALVSVKNHRHGQLNPYAQHQRSVTVDEVLNSRMIADPLTALMCSPITDGAAAAVVCSREFLRRLSPKPAKPPVWIAASVLTTGDYDDQRDISFNGLEALAGRKAFEAAGVGPDDLDFAEVHDCFAIAEFLRCESMGLFKPGSYGRAVERGDAALGGKLPINPSGGLLAKGHPVGATGIAQVAEATWQLRGEAGKHQIEGARLGLTHCSGGGIAGDTAVCSVFILKR